MLPLTTVVWIWRVAMLASLRIACGSWRWAGIALLVWPPIIAEIDAGNVHLLIAAAVAMAIRGRPEAVVPLALTKFASLAAFPLAFMRQRRRLFIGFGIALGIAAVSVALAPTAWVDYLHVILQPLPTYSSWYNLGEAVPLPLRLAAAGVTALLAIRWPRLAAVSATLALPILWVHGFSTLVAVAATPARDEPAMAQA